MNADLLFQKFDTAKRLGCNFVAIKLPHSDSINYIFSSSAPQMHRVQYTPIEKPTFLFSPYGAGNMAYKLVADAFYSNNDLLFGSLSSIQPNDSKSFFCAMHQSNFEASQQFYENYVELIKNKIEEQKLDKVVAARCVQLANEGIENAADYFLNACLNYPDACVYFFSIHGIGSWMGATPEMLLQLENNKLTTVALAGTKNNDTVWTDKEYEEQGMIEFFLKDVFKQIGVKNIIKSELKTINAGNIQHLCRLFSAKINEDVLTAKFHKLLAAINPTPAVCGLPQFDAGLFISQQEKMERRFYSGFFGLQMPDKSIKLYVNIRCAELFNKHAIAYAGAGITLESNATKEWHETEGKLETIQNVLNKTRLNK